MGDCFSINYRASSHDVTDVGQAGKALSELEADPTRFSGLITDISLGRGPDGWEIARRGRELIPDLPVVYISGHGSADWPSKGVPNSLTLSKPFATAQLITAISTLLVEADAHKARGG
jgi:DNA-binding response OmpR family regulator